MQNLLLTLGGLLLAGAALVFAAVLAPDRGAGTTVIEVPAHGPPRPVAWFARYAVRTAVGDGDGTVWALLIERGPDGGSNPATGYLRLREGHWTLFRADGPLALPGVDDQPTTHSSFVTLVTDGRGAVVGEAPRAGEAVVTATFDLDELAAERAGWGLFRDRRPDLYVPVLSLDGSESAV